MRIKLDEKILMVSSVADRMLFYEWLEAENYSSKTKGLYIALERIFLREVKLIDDNSLTPSAKAAMRSARCVMLLDPGTVIFV